MDALTVSAWPVFQALECALWGLKVTFASLFRIGRRLAVLRGNQSALTCAQTLNQSLDAVIDFLSISQYLPWKRRTPDATGKRLECRPPSRRGLVGYQVTAGRCSAPFQTSGNPAPLRACYPAAPFVGSKSFASLTGLKAGRPRLRMRPPEGVSGDKCPPSAVRSYSAGNWLLPFLVQIISPLCFMFHNVLRTVSPSISTVGKCCIRERSTSGAVKRGEGRALIAALMVSLILLYPVSCASIAPSEPFIACNSARFFSILFAASSLIFSSFSISSVSLDWSFTKSGCISEELMAYKKDNASQFTPLQTKNAANGLFLFRNDWGTDL